MGCCGGAVKLSSRRATFKLPRSKRKSKIKDPPPPTPETTIPLEENLTDQEASAKAVEVEEKSKE